MTRLLTAPTAAPHADRPLQPDTPRPPGVPLPLPPRPCHNGAQEVTCPTCGGPVASLLAACWKPACLTADLDFDAAMERLLDL